MFLVREMIFVPKIKLTACLMRLIGYLSFKLNQA